MTLVPKRAAEALSRLSGKALLALWAGVTLLGISSLSVSHMAAMPGPDKAVRMVEAAAAMRRESTALFFVHVVYEQCSCTDRLLAHLLRRGRWRGVEEAIVFVGERAVDDRSSAAARAGFAFTHVTPAQLERRFGLQAAPVLLAFDASARLVYAGGYFDHPSALTALDERIHAQLATGALPQALPVFGCAVSAALRKSVDPLGIVYSRD
jgi:hypothetical protein